MSAALTYEMHDGAIWRWMKNPGAADTPVWLDPDFCPRLLAEHASDPCTHGLADELRAAMVALQNEAMDA